MYTKGVNKSTNKDVFPASISVSGFLSYGLSLECVWFWVLLFVFCFEKESYSNVFTTPLDI